MKYIIITNDIDCIDKLNLEYNMICFLHINSINNINNSNILFFISFSNNSYYDSKYNIYHITKLSDIDVIINKFNLLNIYYDKIFSTSKLQGQNICYRLYDENCSKIKDKNEYFKSLNLKNFSNEFLILISFYIIALEESIKNNYDNILLLNNAIFSDNFHKKFAEKIKNFSKDILLFNPAYNNFENIPAISINKIYYEDILYELNKIIKDITPSFNDIILNKSIFDECLIINSKLVNKIKSNSFDQFKIIHNNLSIDQFIEIFNIKQIHFSKSVQKNYNNLIDLDQYNNNTDPLIIYGVYSDNDINIIENHRGEIFIIWDGNDCNPNYKSILKKVKYIKNLNKVKYHLCDKRITYDILKIHSITPIFISVKKNIDKNILKKSIIYFNEIFKNIFVISLKSDCLKRNLITKKFKEVDINFSFFDAINGKDEPYISEFNKYYNKPFNWNGSHFLERKLKRKVIRSPGAYGYLKTWEKILNFAIEKNLENICIFDDDVLFDYNFHTKFNSFIKDIKVWKVINLGSTQHSWSEVKKLKNKPYYNTPSNTDGSFAVCLKKEVYIELLNQVKLYNCSFDSGALRFLFKKYHKYCFSLYPALVIADVTVSSIGNNRNIFDFSKKVRWNLNNINYSKYLNCIVSVIISVDNSEATIDLCLRSILNQTYKSIEIILIDNYSIDNSCEIINKFKESYKMIKLIKLDEKKEKFHIRNIGIQNSNGKFLIFHEPNFLSMSNRIELQTNIMLQKKIILSGCNFSTLNNDILNNDINSDTFNKLDKEIANYIFCKDQFSLETLMYDSYIFKVLGLFGKSLENNIDNDMINKILKFSNKKKNVNLNSSLLNNIFYKINKLLYVNIPIKLEKINLDKDKSIKKNI